MGNSVRLREFEPTDVMNAIDLIEDNDNENEFIRFSGLEKLGAIENIMSHLMLKSNDQLRVIAIADEHKFCNNAGDDELLGIVTVERVEKKVFKIAFIINEEMRGRLIMTQVIGSITDSVKETSGAVVIVECSHYNESCKRLAERCGYEVKHKTENSITYIK